MSEIKALEWRPYDSWISAETVVGRYTVRPSLATNFAGQWILSKDMETIRLFPSDAAAQAAAQADFDARIRSVLVEGKAEPAAGLQYRPNEFDDWGMIRNQDGSLFAVVRRPLSNDEAAQHRSAKTDPFEDLARRLITSFSTPPAAAVTVPEGWQLVPKEPTREMYAALMETPAVWPEHYTRMLSASPSPVDSRDGLIERLQQMHDEQRSMLGQMLLDRSVDGQRASNWQGGKVNGIASAIALLAAKEQQP